MKRIRRLLQGSSRGLTLVEVIIAMVLFGVLAISFLSAIGTGSILLSGTNERQTAKNLAESQMEYVMSLPFDDGYERSEAIMAEYPGYDVEINVHDISGRDRNIQRVTVIVTRRGEEITRLQGHRTRG